LIVGRSHFAGEFVLVEILNIGRTGPALPISTTVAPGDGLFDVVFLFEIDRKPMLSWLETPESEPPPGSAKGTQHPPQLGAPSRAHRRPRLPPAEKGQPGEDYSR
jgi:hypothetical protein